MEPMEGPTRIQGRDPPVGMCMSMISFISAMTSSAVACFCFCVYVCHMYGCVYVSHVWSNMEERYTMYVCVSVFCVNMHG